MDATWLIGSAEHTVPQEPGKQDPILDVISIALDCIAHGVQNTNDTQEMTRYRLLCWKS